MSFGQAISSVFSKYAKFGGVASRSEYWWWTLFNVLISVVLGGIDSAISGRQDIGVLQTLWGLAVLLPSLAVGVRRLRDAGYSWRFLFLALIPFVGAIILIVLLCQPRSVSTPTQSPAGVSGT
jgi:uncharacterized membrane protein YhaH (DUF805 family)